MYDQAPPVNPAYVEADRQVYSHIPNVVDDIRSSEAVLAPEEISKLVLHIHIRTDHTRGNSLGYMMAAYNFQFAEGLDPSEPRMIQIHTYNINSWRAGRRFYHGYGNNDTMQRAMTTAVRSYEAQETRDIKTDRLFRHGKAKDREYLEGRYRNLVAQTLSVAAQALYDYILSTANAVQFITTTPIHHILTRYRFGHKDITRLPGRDRVRILTEATTKAFEMIGCVNNRSLASIVSDLVLSRRKFHGEAYDEGYDQILALPVRAINKLVETRQIFEVSRSEQLSSKFVAENISKVFREADGMLNDDMGQAIFKRAGSDMKVNIAKDINAQSQDGTIKVYRLKNTGSTRVIVLGVPTVMPKREVPVPGYREELNVQPGANLVIYDTIRAVRGDRPQGRPGNATILNFSKRGPQAVAVNAAFKLPVSGIFGTDTRVRYTPDPRVEGHVHRNSRVFNAHPILKVTYTTSFMPLDPVLLATSSARLSPTLDGGAAPRPTCISLMEWIAYCCVIAATETTGSIDASGQHDCSTYIKEITNALDANPTLDNEELNAVKSFALTDAQLNNDTFFTKWTGLDGGTTRDPAQRAKLMYLACSIGLDNNMTLDALRSAAPQCDDYLVAQIFSDPNIIQLLTQDQGVTDDFVRRFAPAARTRAPPATFIRGARRFFPGDRGIANFPVFAGHLAEEFVNTYLNVSSTALPKLVADKAASLARRLTHTRHWSAAQGLFSRSLSPSSLEDMVAAQMSAPFDTSIVRRVVAEAAHGTIHTSGTMHMAIGDFDHIITNNFDHKMEKHQLLCRFFPWQYPDHSHLLPGAMITDITGGGTALYGTYLDFLKSFNKPPAQHHGSAMAFLPGYGLAGDLDSTFGAVLNPDSKPAHAVVDGRQDTIFRTPYYAEIYLRNVMGPNQQNEIFPFFNSRMWGELNGRIAVADLFQRTLRESSVTPILAIRADNLEGALPGTITVASDVPSLGVDAYALHEAQPYKRSNLGGATIISPQTAQAVVPQ